MAWPGGPRGGPVRRDDAAAAADGGARAVFPFPFAGRVDMLLSFETVCQRSSSSFILHDIVSHPKLCVGLL